MNVPPVGNQPSHPVSSCPLCEARYQPAQARVLAEDGDTRLVHMTCQKCGGATLSLLLSNESGASTVGMVTDLSHDDTLRFRRGRRVTTDDVIDAHRLFAKARLATLFQVSVRAVRTRTKARVKSRRSGSS